MATRALEIAVEAAAGTGGASRVSALWERPEGAFAALVLAHGAGAGMTHAFLERLATALAERGVATLRFQFPYTEAGRRRPDPRGTLLASVRAAVACAAGLAGGLPLFAGGKSMGGRMTTLAASEPEGLSGLRGIVLVGFPLHPAGKPGVERAAHLSDVALPMLFLQGTRDKLAPLERMEPVCRSLGQRATLHVVEGADHGFQVLKRSGRSDDEVLGELAATTAAWMRAQCDAGAA